MGQESVSQRLFDTPLYRYELGKWGLTPCLAVPSMEPLSVILSEAKHKGTQYLPSVTYNEPG